MRIFVDTSIILAFLAGQDNRARELVKEVEKREIDGYINPLVVDEVIYGYLRLTTGLSSRRIRKLLAKRDKRLVGLVKNDVWPVLKLFTTLPLKGEPGEIIRFMEEYGLMPADAIITLTCKQHEITTIATLDKDFKRVPWIKVVQ
ncbi:MAG: PIN domain-containing protein [Desulfurococcales archaeon]|nr:PIN domain-containing protein [Desulfurococcales archaeon]